MDINYCMRELDKKDAEIAKLKHALAERIDSAQKDGDEIARLKTEISNMESTCDSGKCAYISDAVAMTWGLAARKARRKVAPREISEWLELLAKEFSAMATEARGGVK